MVPSSISAAELTRKRKTFYIGMYMARSPNFDPGAFYEVDFEAGSVRTRNGARVLVLTDNAGATLVSAAVKSGEKNAAKAIGSSIAKTALSTGLAEDASPEAVLGEARAVMTTFGWGTLGLERWGNALVATLRDAPETLSSEAIGAIFEGLFSELQGTDVGVAATSNGRFLLLSPEVAATAQSWASAGASLPAIVERLEVA